MMFYFVVFIFLCTLNSYAQEELQIDSLKKRNRVELNKNQQVDNYNQIAYLFGGFNTDSSLFYSHKALFLAEEVGFTSGQATAHSYIARGMIQKGELKNAITNFNSAIPLFVSENDSSNVLSCYRGLGFIYSYGSNKLKSLEYNLKALHLAEQLNDSASLSVIYNNIGAIYRFLDNHESALFYFQKSLDMEVQWQNFYEMAIGFANVGTVRVENNQYAEAAQDFKKVLELLPQVDGNYITVNLDLSLSRYYTTINRFDSASYFIEQSIRKSKRGKLPQYLATAYSRKGELLLKQKRYKKCIRYFEKSLALSDSIGIRDDLPKIYESQAIAYANLGMHNKAYELLLERNSAIDSTKNKEVAVLIGEFEKEQKIKVESERQILEHKLKEQVAENRSIRMRYRLKYAIGIILLLLCIIVVVGYLFLRIRKNKQVLESQNSIINSQKLQLENSLKELEISEENLKQLNVTKDKFFSIIGHDLRSPFNAIIGFSDELTQSYDSYNDQQRKDMIAIISDSSKSTQKLLDNLLNWALSQQERRPLFKKRHSLTRLVETGISAYKSAAALKKLKVTLSIHDNPTVWVDNETIEIVISNLFNNAIKFTQCGGSIHLHSVATAGEVQLCIQDNGIGMTDEIRSGLFEIEKDVRRLGTCSEKGTGLGLLLCNEFVSKNNGKIWVNSTEGKGSEFWISLPASETNSQATGRSYTTLAEA